MTRNEAFEHLMSQPSWGNLCGLKDNTARSFKRNYKEGKISIEKINDLLIKAGYSVVPEKWKKPKGNKKG